MVRRILAGLLKTALGAGAGALVLLGVGQVVGAVASSCSFYCEPGFAGTLGAVSGAILPWLGLGRYEPG